MLGIHGLIAAVVFIIGRALYLSVTAHDTLIVSGPTELIERLASRP